MHELINHTVATLLEVAQIMQDENNESHYAVSHGNALAIYCTGVVRQVEKFQFHIYFWISGKEVEEVKVLELDTLEGAHEKVVSFYTRHITDPINWYSTRYQIVYMDTDVDDEPYNISITSANLRILLNQMTHLRRNQDRTRYIVNGLLGRDSNYTLTPSMGNTGSMVGTSITHNIQKDEETTGMKIISDARILSPELKYSLNSMHLISQLLVIAHP